MINHLIGRRNLIMTHISRENGSVIDAGHKVLHRAPIPSESSPMLKYESAKSINAQDISDEEVDAFDADPNRNRSPMHNGELADRLVPVDQDRRQRLESLKCSEDVRSLKMLLQFEMMNASLRHLKPSLSSQLRAASAVDS